MRRALALAGRKDATHQAGDGLAGFRLVVLVVPGVARKLRAEKILFLEDGNDPADHARTVFGGMGTRLARVTGSPAAGHVSTSFVERSNLTLRMGNRRFTRLTNAFSKKVENHEHSVAITMMHYNFCRIHTTLRVTPAMEAGITDHVWELSEVIAMMEAEAIQT